MHFLNPSPPKQDGINYKPEHDLYYEQAQKDIVLNQYRLILILERIERARERPKWEDALAPAGVALAFLFNIVAADFETDFLGISKATWEAFSVMGLVASVGYSVRRLYLAWRHRKDKGQTAEDIVESLVDDMNKQELSP